MKYTTSCYLNVNDKTLMLYRNKKKDDPNHGKWVGVGGKLENHELPTEAAKREFKEETGLDLLDIKLRGILLFVSDNWEDEMIFLYSATKYCGEQKECNEGELHWVDNNKIFDLSLWEGDIHFLKLLYNQDEYFELKCEYINEICVKTQRVL